MNFLLNNVSDVSDIEKVDIEEIQRTIIHIQNQIANTQSNFSKLLEKGLHLKALDINISMQLKIWMDINKSKHNEWIELIEKTKNSRKIIWNARNEFCDKIKDNIKNYNSDIFLNKIMAKKHKSDLNLNNTIEDHIFESLQLQIVDLKEQIKRLEIECNVMEGNLSSNLGSPEKEIDQEEENCNRLQTVIDNISKINVSKEKEIKILQEKLRSRENDQKKEMPTTQVQINTITEKVIPLEVSTKDKEAEVKEINPSSEEAYLQRDKQFNPKSILKSKILPTTGSAKKIKFSSPLTETFSCAFESDLDNSETIEPDLLNKGFSYKRKIINNINSN